MIRINSRGGVGGVVKGEMAGSHLSFKGSFNDFVMSLFLQKYFELLPLKDRS